MSSISPTWSEIVKAKIEQRDAIIPAEWHIQPTTALSVLDVPATCGLLDTEEIEITETPAPALVESIVKGKLTSYAVTRAFCKRAAIAHQLTNCLTEVLFEEALQLARAIDDEFAQTGRALGALHGLPVSLKDTFRVAGRDTTIGFVAFSNNVESESTESEITKVMRDCGAVLFCKTNVPTAMMMAETYNNIWGYTTNPYRRSLSSGGSSGGEAALLALKGSPLGVGTDIGGSIRIPAAFCGLYSLKPSFGRFPTLGARSGLAGQEAVRGVNGPMSSSLEAVELWSKAVVDRETWDRDPNIIPLPWREVSLSAKLSFGLILDNGVMRPTPPVERALFLLRDALVAAGHEVIVWTPLEAARSMKLLEELFKGDGGSHINKIIQASGEPWPKGLELFEKAFEASQNKPALVSDLWGVQADRLGYAKEALDLWRSTLNVTGTGRPFDAVISPVTPWPACPKYQFGHDVSYTSMWNLLDQTATTFPVTFVDAKKDEKPVYETRNEREKFVWDNYDSHALEGAPVCLQLIGRRLEEEKVLKLTALAVDALNRYRSHSAV